MKHQRNITIKDLEINMMRKNNEGGTKKEQKGTKRNKNEQKGTKKEQKEHFYMRK